MPERILKASLCSVLLAEVVVSYRVVLLHGPARRRMRGRRAEDAAEVLVNASYRVVLFAARLDRRPGRRGRAYTE